MQRPTRCVCAFYSSLVAVALCRIRTTSSDALVYDNSVPLDSFRTRDQSRSACLRALDTIARIVGANRGAVEQGRPHDISHSTDPVRLRLSPVNIALIDRKSTRLNSSHG